ncbi:hypothetical protein B0H14DRAFT_2560493 [Mycena olivaceomarginata]|nr:hypothetical protein B0H14DRAFT_2560493 [Mycena olivaceomarginata]
MMSGTQMDKRKTTTRTKAKSTQPQKKVVDERPEGWLWHLGRLSKMSDTEMDEWSNEGEELTFRVLNVLNLTTPQGDREQGEQKLAELLRTNRSFLKMEDTWTALALQNAQTKPGHSAYAKQKAAMYRKRAEMAQALILGVGYGDLLASDASLVQRVQEERDAERKFLTRLSFASVKAFVQQAFSLLPVLGLVRITIAQRRRRRDDVLRGLCAPWTLAIGTSPFGTLFALRTTHFWHFALRTSHFWHYDSVSYDT